MPGAAFGRCGGSLRGVLVDPLPEAGSAGSGRSGRSPNKIENRGKKELHRGRRSGLVERRGGGRRERGAGAELEVVCVVSKPVEGVHAGRIENIESVSSAIGEAFGEIERRAGIRVTEAYAGISGEFVRCARHTDHVYVFDPQNGVNRKDVEALFDRMRNVQAPDDETIMERVPQNYMIDDAQEVKNPVGSFGKKLSSTFNFILCLRTPMQRLDMALRRVGVKMLAVVSDALATPEAVLSPEEKEEGVAVVDLGGGVTDVTVYYRNVVRYIASIPMGASAINRDIRTMSVPEKHVESLKCKYGSAVADLAPEDKLIRVNGRTSRDAKDILLRNLATVVEARALRTSPNSCCRSCATRGMPTSWPSASC